MKTLIAVPCMDVQESEFSDCLTQLVLRHKDDVDVKYLKASLVYDARNQLAKYVLKEGGYDYVLWLDSDMTFEPDLLDRMLEEQFLAPLRRNSIMSISAIKRQFRALSKASNVIPSESFERINAYRTKVYKGADYLEGIRSFLEKRPPEYKGKASDLDD